jgi:hypothetical protein
VRRINRQPGPRTPEEQAAIDEIEAPVEGYLTLEALACKR